MERQPRLWPSDSDFADKAIWDEAVELAYQRNELEDVISTQEELFEKYRQRNNAKPELIELRESNLEQLRGNALMLDNAIGYLIGPEDGIVQESPYQIHTQGQETAIPKRSIIRYFKGGEQQTIEL